MYLSTMNFYYPIGSSSEWNTVSEETKKSIGFADANNGEFW